MKLYCAFLNCYNLFDYAKGRAIGRGPQTTAQLQGKLADLTDTVRSVFPNRIPDILGLCEVGERRIGRMLGNGICARYLDEWAGDPTSQGGTSQMLLYDRSVLRRTPTPIRCHPGSSRPFWIAAELQFRGGTKGVFWIGVNHWKSNIYQHVLAADEARKIIARELADFFLSSARTTSEAMILMGDFNCEPGD
jgi:hypothetical protein